MTEHIKIQNTPPRVLYAGNGIQDVFPFPFAIFNESDIVVTINGAVQTNNYIINGIGQSTGGDVTFTETPGNNTVIMLERRLPLQRISDFLEGGELAANSLNSELDYITASLQQVNSDGQFALRLPRDDTTSPQLPDAPARANKVLGFNAAGQIAMVETTATYAAPTVTQTGTGAVARSISDKMRDIVSVRDFGAVGNGVTNDAAAFTKALAAHDAVYVPPGTYRINSTITLTNGKTLYGAGIDSVIAASNTSFDAIAITGSDNTLSNLKITAGDVAVLLYGATTPCERNSVFNLTIQNSVTGIMLDGYTNVNNLCAYNRIFNVSIYNVQMHGVHLFVSGAGEAPVNNHFDTVMVKADGPGMSGNGFYIEDAYGNNAFVNCSTDLNVNTAASFRLSNSYATIIMNARTAGSGPNIQTDLGSSYTRVINHDPQSPGNVVTDFSNGNVTVFNSAGFNMTNTLQKTVVSDLQSNLLRLQHFTVALASAGTYIPDLKSSALMVNATNGATTIELPSPTGSNTGIVFMIKKIDASANVVSITQFSGPGPDGITQRLGLQFDRITVMSDGTAWRVLDSTVLRFGTTVVAQAGGTFVPDLSRRLIAVNATGGQTTVELPPANAASSIGRMITVKKTDASTNHVRVTENGAIGPDGAMVSLTTRYHAVTVMSDGTSWNTLSRFSG